MMKKLQSLLSLFRRNKVTAGPDCLDRDFKRLQLLAKLADHDIHNLLVGLDLWFRPTPLNDVVQHLARNLSAFKEYQQEACLLLRHLEEAHDVKDEQKGTAIGCFDSGQPANPTREAQ